MSDLAVVLTGGAALRGRVGVIQCVTKSVLRPTGVTIIVSIDKTNHFFEEDEVTKFLNPNASNERQVCMFCEEGSERVGDLLPVSYPPSMEGGLVCEHCYDYYPFVVVVTQP